MSRLVDRDEMGKHKDFYYKGDIVRCKQYIRGRGASHLNPKYCFCCGKEIKDGESAVLLVSNCKSLPNVLIHEECFKEWEKRTDDLCGDIESAYHQYKQLDMVFGSPVR